MKLTEKYPLLAERLEHLKEAKSMPLKKRIPYYIDFFKGTAIAGVLILGLLIFFIKLIFFTNPYAINASFLNAYGEPSCTEDEFISAFMQYAEIDPKKNNYMFTFCEQFLPDDYATVSKIMVNVAAGEIDFFVCNTSDMYSLANMGYLEDPSLVLPADLLEKYKDDLFYFDYTKNAIDDDDEFGNIPVAVKITDSRILKECGVFDENKEDLYFCFMVNSKQVENSVMFFRWLTEEDSINP